MNLKSWIYTLLAFSNDMNAIQKNKVGRRAARRAAGKSTGGIFRKVFK